MYLGIPELKFAHCISVYCYSDNENILKKVHVCAKDFINRHWKHTEKIGCCHGKLR